MKTCNEKADTNDIVGAYTFHESDIITWYSAEDS